VLAAEPQSTGLLGGLARANKPTRRARCVESVDRRHAITTAAD